MFIFFIQILTKGNHLISDYLTTTTSPSLGVECSLVLSNRSMKLLTDNTFITRPNENEYKQISCYD